MGRHQTQDPPLRGKSPRPSPPGSPRHCRLLLAILAGLLAGCPAKPPSGGQKPISKADADRIVAERFDVDRYVTNQFIPRAGAPQPEPISPRRTLRIGLQWLLTGDAAPWVVAEGKGFFSDMGLDATLEEGGPGRDMLSGLLVGRTDIYVGYPEVALAMITSPTGADLRLICASMKESGVGWMGLDRTIPQGQRSARRITAADLRGRRIGVQPGSDFLVSFLCDQIGLSPNELHLMNEGATPDGLVSGALDYYEGLRSDQPRLLERNGYNNWTFLSMADVGYTAYLDVSVVTADFCRREPAVLACYVAALDRSIRYIAAHPHETAQMMVAAIKVDPGTVEEMETRVRRETPLCFGDGSEALLYIGRERFRNLVSILYRYHRIDLPAR
jgi:ABC-type nitrate/sulfonate/bicarbonate transport system substrate-binding protein